ncbi:MAG: DsbA family protein [Armatimonadota bacterium]
MPEDQATDERNTEEEPRRLTDPIGDDDHTLGNPDANVHILEFGDYECKDCREAHEQVDALLTDRSDEIFYAFRHFPLTNVHPYALSASLAAEAAGRQEKFWEMHGTLFESDGRLEAYRLIEYAMNLNLDLARFARDLADRQLRQDILHRRMQGLKSGVAGTPTFYINTVRWDGEAIAENLSAAVDQAHAKADRV